MDEPPLPRPGRTPPTGRLRRTLRPGVLLMRTGAAQAVAATRAAVTRDASVKEMLEDERLARAAEHAARTMGDMKGAVMKVGQLLSFVDLDLVPPAYRRALEVLQADAPPMPAGLAEQVVEAELGAPIGDLFTYFSPEPIAAASIGQVHMARFGEGDDEVEAVVKVQYPGIADAVEADLANASLVSAVATLAQGALRSLVPQVDARAIVEEIRDRVRDELDYEKEAASQARFADLHRDEPRIHIPRVFPERSGRRVLTMEYVDGMRWRAALDAPKDLRDQWGITIARFVFGSLYRHGLFNADPHPGNYLFHQDGSVTFLDFGCVKEFAPERIEQYWATAAAVKAGDEEAILDHMVALGLLRDRDVGDVAARLFEQVYRAWEPLRAPQPFTYTREWAAAAAADLMEMKFDRETRALVKRLDLPPDQVFLMRITAGLNSVLAGLGATIDWNTLGTDIWGW
ncbi:MAG TPA: AarF/ABC1/UbiB kinase family protein [Acidimicrobiia bacterium]|nr:AarF/ABC1/UbiB kinase family protein [Acidimicrobiia bacterium]